MPSDQGVPEGATFWTHDAGGLYREAVWEYERSLKPRQAEGTDERSPFRRLKAITPAAMSLEALLPEFLLFARFIISPRGPRTDELSAWATEILAMGRHADIRCKYRMAYLALSGRPWPKNHHLHQRMDTLFGMRNAAVHLQPTWYANGGDGGQRRAILSKSFLRRLRKEGLLPPGYQGGRGLSWIHNLVSPGTERWACETVQTVFAHFEAAGGTNTRTFFEVQREGHFRFGS